MTAHADYAKVHEHFIKPFNASFTPLKPGIVQLLVDELAGYSIPALTGGIRRLQMDAKAKPTVRECIAACAAFAPQQQANFGQEMPWDMRDRLAKERADEYVVSFMRKSPQWRQAEAEGWSAFLLGYVQEAALIQSQIIEGVANIGWRGNMVVDIQPGDSAQQAFARYRHTIREQLLRGEVDVPIPAGKIAEWKAARAWLAEWMQRRKGYDFRRVA